MPQTRSASPPLKRRGTSRACDVCRRRKIRCDGPQRDMDECTHCEQNSLECTYLNDAVRKGPPRGYIQMLEQQCARLHDLVGQLRPGLTSHDVESIVGPRLHAKDFDVDAYTQRLRSLRIPAFPVMKVVALPADVMPVDSGVGSVAPAPGSVGSVPLPLLASGPSSRPPLTPLPSKAALRAPACARAVVAPRDDPYVAMSGRDELERNEGEYHYYGPSASHRFLGLVHRDLEDRDTYAREAARARRAALWRTPDWEIATFHEGQAAVDASVWPDDAGARALIEAYFTHVNPHLPLLEASLFKQQYLSKLHLRDYFFAKLCLLVFANGARYIPDQAFVQWGNGGGPFSAGWKYLRAFLALGTCLRRGATLNNLQTAVLMCQFFRGNTSPNVPWVVASTALATTQALGLHVNATLVGLTAVDHELLKRAFWCLYHFDRSTVAMPDSSVETFFPAPIERGTAGADLANFVATVKLDTIVSSAVSLFPTQHDDHPDAIPGLLSRIAGSLVAWHAALPPSLRWDAARFGPDNLGELYAIAHVHARYHWARMHVYYAPVIAASNQAGIPGLPLRSLFAVPLDAAKQIFDIFAVLLALTPPGRPIDFAFIDYGQVAVAVSLLAIHFGLLVDADRAAAFAGIEGVLDGLHQMECSSRKAGQLADHLAAIVEFKRQRVGVVSPPIDALLPESVPPAALMSWLDWSTWGGEGGVPDLPDLEVAMPPPAPLSEMTAGVAPDPWSQLLSSFETSLYPPPEAFDRLA
ncbi:C6 transcription factor domain-containing protein [Vanrija pseudolonga]|uniref:Thiamine repressible genes regulatory protein thi1 n=1 Tax=Vanrija pseudolonga TaxID=143232 RepID=A0AAF0Y4J7_9TREE|nr:Thiamine repressible genes regulatory protein thi1 [Vanrija pseudolonga]